MKQNYTRTELLSASGPAHIQRIWYVSDRKGNVLWKNVSRPNNWNVLSTTQQVWCSCRGKL